MHLTEDERMSGKKPRIKGNQEKEEEENVHQLHRDAAIGNERNFMKKQDHSPSLKRRRCE